MSAIAPRKPTSYIVKMRYLDAHATVEHVELDDAYQALCHFVTSQVTQHEPDMPAYKLLHAMASLNVLDSLQAMFDASRRAKRGRIARSSPVLELSIEPTFAKSNSEEPHG